jgi:hypothetical protein
LTSPPQPLHALLCIAAYGFLVTERLVAEKKLLPIPIGYPAKCLPYPKASGPGAPLLSSAMCPTPLQRCDWSLLPRCLPVLNGVRAVAGKPSNLLTQS